jgi:proline iminopeptidase
MKLAFSILAFLISIHFCNGQMAKDSFYYKKIDEKGVKFISVSNGKYKVFTQKIGDGKIKLLLLHGGPVNTHEYFENFPENLKNEGIEVYYYDQLGSYYSDQPNDTTIWNEYNLIEQVEEVRKGLNLKNFYLLGHSWGGMLAQLYAAKYSKNLKGLILSNTPAQIRDTAKLNVSKRALTTNIDKQIKALPEFSKISPITMDSIGERIKIADTVLYAALVKIYNTKVDSIVRRNFNYRGDIRPEPLVRNGLHTNRKLREQIRQVYEISGSDYPSALEKIKCPVLIIGGFYDRMYQELYPEMKNIFIKTKVRIYLCPNGSHFSMWDDTENYFREIIRFLKNVQSNSFDPDK